MAIDREAELCDRLAKLHVAIEETCGLKVMLECCEDEECTICGELACPFDEPLHFHHDGCPACETQGK